MIAAMMMPPVAMGDTSGGAATRRGTTLRSTLQPQSERGTLMERFVVISADCHAVGRPEDFTPYLEAQYLDASTRSSCDAAVGGRRAARARRRKRAACCSRVRRSTSTTATRRPKRVAGGTVGPVGLRPTRQGARGRRRRRRSRVPERRPVRHRARRRRRTRASCAPRACSRTTGGWPTSARRHRGRRAGIAQLPIHDVDLAIAEIETAAARGLKGVTVPILFDDTEAPPLYHERYAPMWAACEANDMPVHVHGGAGPDYGDGVDTLAADHAVRHRGADVAEAHPLVPPLERHPRAAPRSAPGVHRGNVRLGAGVGELPRLPLRVEGLRAHPRRAPDEAE